MADTKKTRTISYADAAKQINQGMEGSDTLRNAGLAKLARVRAVKQTSLQREQKRLTAKLGEGNPRVLTLKNRISANGQAIQEVSTAVDRSNTPATQPDPKSWILQGHVYDTQFKPLADYTVALYDSQNQWVQSLGYACTDSKGFYQIDIPLPANAAPAGGTAKDGAPSALPAQVYIHVLSKGTPLYSDTQPLAPALNKVDYRDLVIDPAAASCAPPEETGKQPPGPGKKSKK
jgi:hypothetical protein